MRMLIFSVIFFAQINIVYSQNLSDEPMTKVRQMWDAVQKASPEFSKLFCSDSKGICLSDWPDYRSPLGGWRLIDPKTCKIDPSPCPLGPSINLAEQNLTAWPPTGPLPEWAPCDVYPDSGDSSTLKCDDTCGCTILRANCAGTWSCNSNECSCGP